MTIFWWHWVVLGLVLAVAEVATAGGFYIIFFGVGAILVGILAALGVAGPEWTQLLLFAGLSITALALFRSPLMKKMQVNPQAPGIDTLVGEIGTAAEDLRPGTVGRVELRGTAWSGRNRTHHTVHTGTRVRVVGVEGLTVDVEPEGAHS
jgi:membrane protein implicated in regulation of membrane protease activity